MQMIECIIEDYISRTENLALMNQDITDAVNETEIDLCGSTMTNEQCLENSLNSYWA